MTDREEYIRLGLQGDGKLGAQITGFTDGSMPTAAPEAAGNGRRHTYLPAAP